MAKLLDTDVEPIAAADYWTPHLLIDMVLVAVLAVAILPLLLFGHFRRHLQQTVRVRWVVGNVLVHVALPIVLLALVPTAFATPLWVARAFVPDVYWTIIAAVTLLVSTGMAKGFHIVRHGMRVC